MIVDCDRCEVRGDACGGCVITVLLGAPPGGLQLDSSACRALDTLAAAGMVPRLQLVECDERHAVSRVTPVDEGAVPDHAERSAAGAERLERHAG